MTWTRRLSAVLAAGLLAGVLTAAPASSATTASKVPCAAMETLALETFKVVAKPRSDVYRIGEKAVIDIKLTRPADEDPVGQGIPMPAGYSEPAPDVNVGVGLRVSDGRDTTVFLFGLGITDAEGKATIKIKLKNYAPAGTAWADVFAYKEQVQTPCLTVQEFGYESIPEAFRVDR